MLSNKTLFTSGMFTKSDCQWRIYYNSEVVRIFQRKRPNVETFVVRRPNAGWRTVAANCCCCCWLRNVACIFITQRCRFWNESKPSLRMVIYFIFFFPRKAFAPNYIRTSFTPPSPVGMYTMVFGWTGFRLRRYTSGRAGSRPVVCTPRALGRLSLGAGIKGNV